MDRVLLVDDEERLLAGIRRNLRRSFDVTTALSGAEGLEKIEKEGPFAVLVSDMQMPEMNGVEFLNRSKDLAPDSVRIMLTGNADQETATQAINTADVFKFLNKPVEANELTEVLSQAASVYKSKKIERDLLERTFQGSVDVLIEVMALAKPDVFGRSARLAEVAVEVGERVGLDESWALRTSAMLCHIGCMHGSDELLSKLADGEELSDAQRKEYAQFINQGADLLQKIPRLEDVAEAIRFQAVVQTSDAAEELEDGSLISRVLQAVLAADACESRGVTGKEVVLELREDADFYHGDVLAALEESILARADDQVKTVTVSMLNQNMVLAEDVKDENGVLLVCRGWQTKSTVIKHLQRAAMNGQIPDEIKVYQSEPMVE